jgi:hypothetical protein
VKATSEVLDMQALQDRDSQPPAPASAPPHPPANAAPWALTTGQIWNQAMADFRQLLRIAKLGVKEIYYYTDRKVTFSNVE